MFHSCALNTLSIFTIERFVFIAYLLMSDDPFERFTLFLFLSMIITLYNLVSLTIYCTYFYVKKSASLKCSA